MTPSRRQAVRLAGALALSGALGRGWAQTPSPVRRSAGVASAGGVRLVLGQSIPMTGAAAEIGLAFAGGAKLFVDAYNAQPERSGPQIELRQLDDGYDAARAQANASRLVKEGADVLFGFVGTAGAQAGAQVAQQQGLPFFAPFAAADTLRDRAHPNVFHVRPSMLDEAHAMLRHCATLSQTRIAVVVDDDAMGEAALQAIEAAARELKLPAPVAVAKVRSASDADVQAAAQALSKAQPQAILQASLSPTTAAFVRAVRQTGYASALMTFSVVGIDPLYTALGKDIRGIIISQVVPSPRKNSRTPIVQAYLAALADSEQTSSYEGLEGFIAAKALAEAAHRGGPGASRAALLAAMQGMNAYDVGGLRLNLRPPLRDPSRTIELVYLTAEGRILR